LLGGNRTQSAKSLQIIYLNYQILQIGISIKWRAFADHNRSDASPFLLSAAQRIMLSELAG
jgi:hypothetical protein